MAFNLTYWLRKSPQPAALLADDKRIDVPRNARSWRDLTATISSLDPSKLTALDAAGNVIRSVVLESEADTDKPAPSAVMSDLQFFGNLLAEAYDKGSSKMQPIVDSAMAFVERGGTRLAKVESENDRLRAHIHKLTQQLGDLSGAAPDGDDSLLGTIMAGALQAQAGAANPLAAVAALNPKQAKK